MNLPSYRRRKTRTQRIYENEEEHRSHQTKKINAAAQGTYNAPSYCKPHPMSKDDESIMRFFEVQDQDGSGEGGETSLLGDP